MRGKHGSELNSMLIQKHEYTEQTGEIVPPRTPSEFKPLSDKNKFWLALRREPLRDMSFINGGPEYRRLGEPA